MDMLIKAYESQKVLKSPDSSSMNLDEQLNHENSLIHPEITAYDFQYMSLHHDFSRLALD